MVKIIFVCTGNLCRSPAAEAILNFLIKQDGLDNEISCASAGTLGTHVGNEHDPRMDKVCRDHGFKVTGRAKQFAASDFTKFDLIFAMDSENLRYLLSLPQAEKFKKKIKLFGQLNILYDPEDVPDPYYAGPDQFLETFEIIKDGCLGLMKILKN